jgi:transcriptional regulator with XRE-family HTH domain
MYHIGHVLKQLRDERGWDQHEVHRLSRVGINTISKIERDPSRVKLSTLRKLAAAFDLTVDDLFARVPVVATPATPAAPSPAAIDILLHRLMAYWPSLTTKDKEGLIDLAHLLLEARGHIVNANVISQSA